MEKEESQRYTLLEQVIYSFNSVIDLDKFWRWHSFDKYLGFLMYFIIGYFLLYTCCYGAIMIQFTGIACQFCDACVSLPQALRNWKLGSAKGLR